MDSVRALVRDGLAYTVRGGDGCYVMFDLTAATAKSPDAARRYLALSPPPVRYPVCAPLARSPLDCALWVASPEGAASNAHGQSRGLLTVNARYIAGIFTT